MLRTAEVEDGAGSSCSKGCFGYALRFVFNLNIYIFNLNMYIFRLNIYIFRLKIYIFNVEINLEIGIKHLSRHTEVPLVWILRYFPNKG